MKNSYLLFCLNARRRFLAIFPHRLAGGILTERLVELREGVGEIDSLI
jgi:hypothetical protein